MMAMSMVVHAIQGPGSVNRTEEPKLREEGPPPAASQPSPHPLPVTQQLRERPSGPETACCTGLRPGAHRAMPGSAWPLTVLESSAGGIEPDPGRAPPGLCERVRAVSLTARVPAPADAQHTSAGARRLAPCCIRYFSTSAVLTVRSHQTICGVSACTQLACAGALELLSVCNITCSSQQSHTHVVL